MSDQLIGIISGSLNLFLSIFLAAFSTYFSFLIFNKLTKEINEIEELKNNNIAVGVLLSGFIVSFGIIFKTILEPFLSIFQTYLYQNLTGLMWFKLICYFLFYLSTVIIISIPSIWLSILIFIKLTKNIDEFNEIKKNNIAVSIVFATVIVIMGILICDGIKILMDALIPLDTLKKIQIM